MDLFFFTVYSVLYIIHLSGFLFCEDENSACENHYNRIFFLDIFCVFPAIIALHVQFLKLTYIVITRMYIYLYVYIYSSTDRYVDWKKLRIVTLLW